MEPSCSQSITRATIVVANAARPPRLRFSRVGGYASDATRDSLFSCLNAMCCIGRHLYLHERLALHQSCKELLAMAQDAIGTLGCWSFERMGLLSSAARSPYSHTTMQLALRMGIRGLQWNFACGSRYTLASQNEAVRERARKRRRRNGEPSVVHVEGYAPARFFGVAAVNALNMRAQAFRSPIELIPHTARFHMGSLFGEEETDTECEESPEASTQVILFTLRVSVGYDGETMHLHPQFRLPGRRVPQPLPLLLPKSAAQLLRALHDRRLRIYVA